MPRRLAADAETLTERYGRFSAQPFERGFGTTIGNSLRRALLSSIEGAAVTAIKIEGVEHEFSSIKGVVEDAPSNTELKQVPLSCTERSKDLRISKGRGRGTAAGLEADAMWKYGRSVHRDGQRRRPLKVEMRLSVVAVTFPQIETSTKIFRLDIFRLIRSTPR